LVILLYNSVLKLKFLNIHKKKWILKNIFSHEICYFFFYFSVQYIPVNKPYLDLTRDHYKPKRLLTVLYVLLWRTNCVFVVMLKRHRKIKVLHNKTHLLLLYSIILDFLVKRLEFFLIISDAVYFSIFFSFIIQTKRWINTTRTVPIISLEGLELIITILLILLLNYLVTMIFWVNSNRYMNANFRI